MAIYSLKPTFQRLLAPVARWAMRTGVSADAVTVAGVVFAGVAGLGLWAGRDGDVWLLLVPLGALLRTGANALDGMIARSTGTVRPAGEILNEVSDRLGDVAVFLPLAVVPGVPAGLVAGALAAMLVASYVGLAVKAAGGSRIYGGVMGKPDRMFVIAVAAIVAMAADPGTVFTWALVLILVGAAATIVIRWRSGLRDLARS